MELLHAIQVKDLTEQPRTDAAYEDYKEGTWGARDRQSPIHEALFNLKSEGKQWRDGVMALMRKGADVNAKFEVREGPSRELFGRRTNRSIQRYDWRGCGRTESAFELLLSYALLERDGEMLNEALQRGGDANVKSVSTTHSMRTDGPHRQLRDPHRLQAAVLRVCQGVAGQYPDAHLSSVPARSSAGLSDSGIDDGVLRRTPMQTWTRCSVPLTTTSEGTTSTLSKRRCT